MDFEDQSNVHLVPCNYCGRTFSKESIHKHRQICQKTSQKRPVFDSSKQRAFEITDRKAKSKKATFSAKPTTRGTHSNWRQKHEDFIKTVRAAREVTAAIKEGRELPPPPPPTINPDYIQCPHCMRRFNENAAERHIKFCAEQQKRLVNKKNSPSNTNSLAATRSSARQNYRPPPPQPSAGRRKLDDTRSAPFRSTRARTNNDHQISSNQFKNNTYKINSVSGKTNSAAHERFSSTKPRRATNPEWDGTIEPASLNTEVRTKTGLKPVAAANHSNDRAGQQKISSNSAKPAVRKVAGRDKADRYSNGGWNKKSSLHQRPRHDWSSDSNDTDSGGEVGRYNASAYDSSSRNRYTVVNGTRRSSASSDSSKRANSVGKGKQMQHKGAIKGYSNGLREGLTDFSHNRDDFYDWMQARQPSHETTVTNKKASSQPSKFCHECGARYPVVNAKFCCECGIKRITL
ncbi:uncharacterized protein LOC143470124 [Clavelina lepadiformis]|uniref:uncharacterized protein LOC143470124 n=1 Tax=Clavelina lepadiformis TaxID=159417 RepID=UPI0040413A3B